MKKENKIKWAKGTSRDKAYNMGFHLGVRRTLEFLSEEDMIDTGWIAFLFEERYLKEIKERD